MAHDQLVSSLWLSLLSYFVPLQLARALLFGPLLSRLYLLCVFYCFRSHLVPSKPKDHATHLERCLLLWHEGKLEDLVVEGRAIQSRLPQGVHIYV